MKKEKNVILFHFDCSDIEYAKNITEILAKQQPQHRLKYAEFINIKICKICVLEINVFLFYI